MLVREIIDKASYGDKIYVIKPITIRWSSMRFENTNIVYATYILNEQEHMSPYGGNTIHRSLKSIDQPKGTKTFPTVITTTMSTDFQCFFTPEEAEIKKILELKDLEKNVEDYINELRQKTVNKVLQLKQNERLTEYLTKYPEHFIKVL